VKRTFLNIPVSAETKAACKHAAGNTPVARWVRELVERELARINRRKKP
jgi:hypothetical protein